MKPTSGSVHIDGMDIAKNSSEVRESIGLISHSVFLYKDLNAVENLRYYGRLYGLSGLDPKIDLLLGRFGLLHRKFDPVRTYSRGMMQRLTIARSVLHDPTFLLLDEPFTGLDREAAGELTSLVRELHDMGHTILLVTHNLERGLELSDRVAIMTKGKIAWESETADLSLDDFRGVYTQHSAEGAG